MLSLFIALLIFALNLIFGNKDTGVYYKKFNSPKEWVTFCFSHPYMTKIFKFLINIGIYAYFLGALIDIVILWFNRDNLCIPFYKEAVYVFCTAFVLLSALKISLYMAYGVLHSLKEITIKTIIW